MKKNQSARCFWIDMYVCRTNLAEHLRLNSNEIAVHQQLQITAADQLAQCIKTVDVATAIKLAELDSHIAVACASPILQQHWNEIWWGMACNPALQPAQDANNKMYS